MGQLSTALAEYLVFHRPASDLVPCPRNFAMFDNWDLMAVKCDRSQLPQHYPVLGDFEVQVRRLSIRKSRKLEMGWSLALTVPCLPYWLICDAWLGMSGRTI